MRVLSAPELLNVWEQGLAQPPLQRALLLLAAACSETSLEVLATLSIGQRDARLLTLREWTFGSQLVCVVACPSCGEPLELTFAAADLRAIPEAEPMETLALSVTGYELGFRLPNSSDLAAVANYKDIAAIRQLLLERCLSTVRHYGEPVSTDQLPADVVDTLVERMAQADPQADMQLALSCPRCDNQWQAAFDIESFFWSEINAWAQRILQEVHVLASAYGWREMDILSLSPWRRQFYLDRVSG